MKIKCRVDEMSHAMQIIQAGLSQRTTLPILLNFLLETDGSKLKLSSTDLSMSVRHNMKAEVEQPGSITIPAKKFFDILRTLVPEKDISIHLDPEGRIHLFSDRSRFVMTGTPKSSYPVIGELPTDDAFEIPSTVLSEMIKKTIFAASTDETRYVLNGVFWNGTGGNLEMVATDGRRLAFVYKKLLPDGRDVKAIIPNKMLHELMRIISSEPEDSKVIIHINENQIGVQMNETTMISRLVEGSFPNYQQIIPSKSDIQAYFPTKEILHITRQAALGCTDRGGSVRFTLKKGVLHVQSASQTVQFDDELPIEYKGGEFSISFNPDFLIDALKALDSEKVVFNFTTPTHPVLVEPEGQGGFKYVVMPLRG
jgi:DNA polymerase-3 subunit beta